MTVLRESEGVNGDVLAHDEVVEEDPSIAGRLAYLFSRTTIRPALVLGSYLPRAPWPWGLVDFAAQALKPAPGTVRATIR